MALWPKTVSYSPTFFICAKKIERLDNFPSLYILEKDL